MIYCVYHLFDDGYACRIKEQTIPADAKFRIFGAHLNGKTNKDVKFIDFTACTISKVPKGLTEIFPNIQGMGIINSGLKELSRDDLVEYKKLKYLHFRQNQIEFLAGDLFTGFKKLESISFSDNPLKNVEPNILDGLINRLKHVDLDGSINKYGKIGDSKSEAVIGKYDKRLVDMKHRLVAIFMSSTYRKLKTDYKKLQKDYEELTEIHQNLMQQHLQKSKMELKSSMKKLQPTSSYKDQKLATDFKTFIQTDESLKDFYIIIDDHQFHVHKLVLAARSPTLAEILSNNPEAENLKLVDISVDVFKIILKFLYTSELPNDVNLMQLFAAAGRLKIEELSSYAAGKLLQQLNGNNAMEILNLANKYGHDGMSRKAFEEIKMKYPKIEFKDEWLMDGARIQKVINVFEIWELVRN